VPIAVDKKAGASLKRDVAISLLSDRVKLKEIAVFSRQFATMIKSGLTLLRALSILVVQTDNKFFAGVVDQLRLDIQSGSSLSQLSRHPKQFNRLLCGHGAGR
jgi:type IV pilus assembly protein PilC